MLSTKAGALDYLDLRPSNKTESIGVRSRGFHEAVCRVKSRLSLSSIDTPISPPINSRTCSIRHNSLIRFYEFNNLPSCTSPFIACRFIFKIEVRKYFVPLKRKRKICFLLKKFQYHFFTPLFLTGLQIFSCF